MSRRAAWIGLGKIAGHHLEALEHADDLLTPVAGCDPNDAARRRYQDRIQVYISVPAMLTEQRPDVVIVASPTPTHAQVCHEVLSIADVHAPAFLLVEKPIAASPKDLKRLIAAAADADVQLRGLYHAAYAPEVNWAVGKLASLSEPLTRIESDFFDPYADEDVTRRKAIYGDSWLDSGINALSIWARFTEISSVVVAEHETLVSTYNAQVDALSRGQPLSGHIFTSWQAGAPAKCTRLLLADDGQLVMNHQAGAAQVFRGTELVEAWGYRGEMSRLASHYLGTFRSALNLDSVPLDDAKLLALLLTGRS